MGVSSSPLANRNQYKPPTMLKRPNGNGAPGATNAGGGERAPLADVSTAVIANPNGAGTGGNGAGHDAKRMRLS